AFHLHIHILWGLFSQDDVPPPVSTLTTDNFQQQFQSSDDIRAHVENLIDANRVEEAHLFIMFNAVANLGLICWQPDVLGTVESIYNALHEHLAISTFKTVATTFGYTSMNANLSFLSNYSFLVKLYRSFVFGLMAEKALKEGKATGGVAMENECRNMY
ncbi:hypothetical protein BT96DRAFT_842951, partial [Gymnopus androsaceus JB14]